MWFSSRPEPNQSVVPGLTSLTSSISLSAGTARLAALFGQTRQRLPGLRKTQLQVADLRVGNGDGGVDGADLPCYRSTHGLRINTICSDGAVTFWSKGWFSMPPEAETIFQTYWRVSVKGGTPR